MILFAWGLRKPCTMEGYPQPKDQVYLLPRYLLCFACRLGSSSASNAVIFVWYTKKHEDQLDNYEGKIQKQSIIPFMASRNFFGKHHYPKHIGTYWQLYPD